MSSEEKQISLHGDDALAAEYVVGVQTAEEHAKLEKRCSEDPVFAALVGKWQNRLSPLNDAYEAIEPSTLVKQALDQRLFPENKTKTLGFWHNLTLWRGLAFAGFAFGFIMFLPRLSLFEEGATRVPLIASLQAETGDVRFLALHASEESLIRINIINAEKQSTQDFELWLIEEDGIPQSLGILPIAGKLEVKLSSNTNDKLNSGDTLAISLEPLGGSPNGEVTGPVIAVGKTHKI